MAAECVGACESPAAAPLRAALERAFADKFLLAAVQALVTFAVVLPCEGFATDSAYERTLVCVRPEMRAEIVSAGEALRAEIALESCGMFLYAPALRAV